MSILDRLLSVPQYSLPRHEKEPLLLQGLLSLQDHHLAACSPFARIMAAFPSSSPDHCIASFPFFPVRLFKELDLRSIPGDAVMKVLTSSGTGTGQVSRVAVDRETSLLQTKCLASIVTSFIGPKRLPMIIVDSSSQLQDRSQLSARGAGMVGLANFGRDHFYALDDQMRLDINGLKNFAARHGSGPVLVFGFTFMIWQYLVGELARLGEKVSLEQGILIHGGGWKKLQEHAVDNDTFKKMLGEYCGISRVHNFYGMVEQVGSIYMECEQGFLHSPNFAEVLIRDPENWRPCPPGTPGVIETLSLLPRSYPGHSLLTEDVGTIHGFDDCPCGRLGTRFTVAGRLSKAELRGCSDTHAYRQDLIAGTEQPTVLFPFCCAADETRTLTESLLISGGMYSFADETVAFLDAVSKMIFASPRLLEFPDLAALAFWLRRANMSGYVLEYKATVAADELLAPRGIAFHVAPSNVETIAIYSWALSLLGGNANIVRLPQQRTPGFEMFLDRLSGLVADPAWRFIAERNLMLTYPRDSEFNNVFSSVADLRIIWGGDDTIQFFRGLPTKPAAKDVVFADRVSHALVQASRYLALSENQAAETARLFRNDAYQFNQLACSSPRVVYFVGTSEECRSASRRFWEMLRRAVMLKGGSESGVAMDKLVYGCRVAAQGREMYFPYSLPDGGPAVVHVKQEQEFSSDTFCGGGFFFEAFVGSTADIAPFVSKKDQTLTYVGFNKSEIKDIALSLCSKGIERVVPMGHALDFSPTWDGYVLFSEMTRRIALE